MEKPARMDIELLIKCVRKHVFLYDMDHKYYKNVSRKKSAWESIGREVNQTGLAAKTKWKSLRRGYTSYKNELKGMNGCTRKSTYVWGSQLSFLDNYKITRFTDSSAFEPPTSPLRIEIPSHDETSNARSNPSTPSPMQLKISPPDSPEFVLSTPDAPGASSHTAQSIRRNKKKKIDDNMDTMTHFSNNIKKDGHDGVDYLFLSYADTFKKFPPREQALLKLELAKLFTDTELRLLHNSDDTKSQHSLLPDCI